MVSVDYALGFYTLTSVLLSVLVIKLNQNILKLLLLFITLINIIITPQLIINFMSDAGVTNITIHNLLNTSYQTLTFTLITTTIYFIIYFVWTVLLPKHYAM